MQDKRRQLLLNLTGVELTTDMSCPNTIEPYKLDKNAEEFCYDEFNNLSLNDRIDRIIALVDDHRYQVGAYIVINNELGRGLMERLPKENFYTSVKRPGSSLHWIWQKIHDNKDFSFIPPKKTDDEWLKQAIGAVDVPERDFFNVWTSGGENAWLPVEVAKRIRNTEPLTQEELLRWSLVLDKTVNDLYKAIEHGDEEHRAWLKEALQNFFSGKPVPSERPAPAKPNVVESRIPSNVQIVNMHPRPFDGQSYKVTGVADVSRKAPPNKR